MGCPRKLTEAQVMEAFTSSEPGMLMAARFGVHKKTVYMIRDGRLYRDITGAPDPHARERWSDLPGEHWLPVVGFEGRYDVSDMGRVRSLLCRGLLRAFPHLMTPAPGAGGYLHVTLRAHVGGPPLSTRVHHLVLEAFVGPRKADEQGRHGVAGKLVNRLDNLCWGTAQENADDRRDHGTLCCGDRHHWTKLNADTVREIRRRVANGERQVDLADEFGCGRQNINQIVKRRSWKHV